MKRRAQALLKLYCMFLIVDNITSMCFRYVVSGFSRTVAGITVRLKADTTY
jgi:hypothetical protein